MKITAIVIGCLIVGGVLGFFATESDINFMTSDWIYGTIFGSLFISGWAMNIQRDELLKRIGELKDRIVELENPDWPK